MFASVAVALLRRLHGALVVVVLVLVGKSYTTLDYTRLDNTIVYYTIVPLPSVQQPTFQQFANKSIIIQLHVAVQLNS